MRGLIKPDKKQDKNVPNEKFEYFTTVCEYYGRWEKKSRV
jgi:hypothetical protein